LTGRSLKTLANQLKEEIARFESRAATGPGGLEAVAWPKALRALRLSGDDPLFDVESGREILTMKAVEFQSRLNPDQTLTVPASLTAAIPIGQAVRVLVLIPESDTDSEWEQLTAEEFGRGYADTDAIYDQLSAG
jgi:hypothetical protein